MKMYIARDLLPSLYNGINGVPRSINDIGTILANVIQILLALGGVLAVVFIIWSAIIYIVSQGDSGRTKDAKNGITNAIVGLILMSGAYLLVDFFARRFS